MIGVMLCGCLTTQSYSDQRWQRASAEADEIVKPAGHVAFGFTGSRRTMNKVQIGPKNNEPNHHPKPLLPLPCARPALMSDSVSQPTAYSLVFCIKYRVIRLEL